MIQAKELRIGNTILWGSIVINVTAEFIMLMEQGVDVKAHETNPIPLDEEWLLKFGLLREDSVGTDIHIEFHGEIDVKSSVDIKGAQRKYTLYTTGWKRDIKYVHQLQNLYFTLTGEELTIKETV